MGVLAVLVFLGSGGIFVIAALISAYNAAQSSNASIGLGIASVGFSLGAALCYLVAAWLLRHTAFPSTRADADYRLPQ